MTMKTHELSESVEHITSRIKREIYRITIIHRKERKAWINSGKLKKLEKRNKMSRK